jgi:hypothetical protein
VTKRAFSGETYVDIEIKTLGVSMKRVVEVLYDYTPPWPHYDRRLKKEVIARTGLDLRLAVLAKRMGRKNLDALADDSLVWISIDGLMEYGLFRPRVYDRLVKHIDRAARATDRIERRQACHVLPPDDAI